jgi:WD40 repeat protein
MRLLKFAKPGITLLILLGAAPLCFGQLPTYLCSEKVFNLAFSPSKTHVYASSVGKIECWNLDTRTSAQIFSFEKDIPFIHLSVSTDSQYIVASTLDKQIILWHDGEKSSASRLNVESIPNTLQFVGKNKFLLVGLRDGSLLKYSIPDLVLLEKKQLCSEEVTGIAVSDSTSMIAVSGAGRKIWLFNNENLHCLDSIQAHRDWIRALSFNGNGSFLYSCGDDGRVKGYLVNFNRLSPMESKSSGYHMHWLTTLDARETNQVATTTPNGLITVWTSRFRCKLKTGDKVFAIKFLPDRLFISLCLATDKGLRIISNPELSEGHMKYY